MTTGRINQIAVERIERVESNALRPGLANQTEQREGRLRPVHDSLKRFFDRRADSPLPGIQQAPFNRFQFRDAGSFPVRGRTTARPAVQLTRTGLSLHTITDARSHIQHAPQGSGFRSPEGRDSRRAVKFLGKPPTAQRHESLVLTDFTAWYTCFDASVASNRP